MHTKTCPTCRQPIRPSAAYVRRLRLGGWAGMKHHLVAIGVIPSTDHDAPVEWQDAFCRAFGRRLTARADAPTPKGEWAKAGDTVTVDGVMVGRVQRVVNTASVPYAVVQWPSSTGRHTITTLRKVAR